MLLIPPIPIKAKYFVLIFGVIELFSGVMRPNSGIAHFAHLGGMIVGFILIKYWGLKGEKEYY
jgi:membrane associated rhomboid family serine protease